MLSKEKTVRVTDANLADFLGVPKFRYGEVEAEAAPAGVIAN